MNDDSRELRTLASLPLLAPSDARQRRVQARCHAALGCRRRPERGVAPRLLDAALVAAACIYVAAAVSEAIRLISAS